MQIEKLEAIAHKTSENLYGLIIGMQDEISKAIEATTEQAEHENKEALVISLSHGIKLDLGKDTLEDKLSVTATFKDTVKTALPDPNQPELPGVEGTGVTVSTGETSVTISGDEAGEIASAIEDANSTEEG